MEHFGERVKTVRGTYGWTRRALAKKAGLNEFHLANVERGKRLHVEGDTILKLAQALGVSADYLIGLTDDPTPRTPASVG